MTLVYSVLFAPLLFFTILGIRGRRGPWAALVGWGLLLSVLPDLVPAVHMEGGWTERFDETVRWVAGAIGLLPASDIQP